MRKTFVVLTAGLAGADEPQANIQRPVVLLTSPLIATQTVACLLTAARNTTVSVAVVNNGFASEQLLAPRHLPAGASLALVPRGRFGVGYCKFTVHAGGRNAIRASACAFDGVTCLSSVDAR